MTTEHGAAPDDTPRDRGPLKGPLGVDRDAHPHRCTAMSKRSKQRCRAYAIKGAAVCRAHGGAAKQVRAAAAARKLAAAAQADAERLLAHEAVDRMADPWETLGRLAVEADAMKQALGERVNALGSALRYTAPGAGTEQLRAEVALYERAMDRSAKFADMLLRHNWEAKKIELAAGQARIVVEAVQRGLVALPELLPEQRSRFTAAFLDGLQVARGAQSAAAVLSEPMAGATEPETVRGELE